MEYRGCNEKGLISQLLKSPKYQKKNRNIWINLSSYYGLFGIIVCVPIPS